MAEKAFDKALRKNPQLKKYVDDYKKKTNTEPIFFEQLHDSMGDLARPNLIYPVGDPIFIHIHGDKEIGRRYVAIEPKSISVEEEAKLQKLREIIFDKIGFEPSCETEEQLGETINRLLKESVKLTKASKMLKKDKNQGLVLTKEEKLSFEYLIKRDILKIGTLEPLMHDPYLEDIHCVGNHNISVVHKIFGNITTNIKFESEESLDHYVTTMSERAGKPVSMGVPIVDSALPDGSRMNIIYAEDVSIKGPSFTIRKFSPEPTSFVKLLDYNTLDATLAAYLWICLENGMSLFVCGETASGKTTTLNAIIPFIGHNSKIYSVEDTVEIKSPHRIWQQLLTRETGAMDTRVDTFALLKAALRSRPDYILVGEIRGAEGAVAFQAMQSGHSVMATFHASSLEKMIQRFTGDPINVPIRFLDNLNVVVIQQAVYIEGKMARRILSVFEIIGYFKETNNIMSREVFRWDDATDSYRFRGMHNSFILENLVAKSKGYLDTRKIYEDLEQRTKIVDLMKNSGITKYYEVRDQIQDYQVHGYGDVEE